MSIHPSLPSLQLLHRRTRIVAAFLAGFFVILVARVWYLQILQGHIYKERSIRQRTRIQRVFAPRGEFLDREGRILVDTRPGFNITITREDVQDLDQTLQRLSRLTGLSPEKAKETLRRAREKGTPAFQPIRLLTNVNWKTVALLEATPMNLPGIDISPEPLRNFRYGDLFAHGFGYLGEISRTELSQPAFRNDRVGDEIGKAGLEKILQQELKGTDGFRRVEVNSRGRIIDETAGHPPVPGNRIFLTIDLDLQRTLEKAFGNQAGAGVVLNVNNGEILAMASRPTFRPDLFSGGIPRKKWNELLHDPLHPLTNKAISGQYPPGSVFKIVVAVAALEEKVISPDETITCRGYIGFGGRHYRCWKRGGHGKIGLTRALIESCDVYFYEVGERLGIDKIAEYARSLGLGSPTGILLEGERAGLIPDRSWKQRVRKEPWFPGETLSASIGQGYILVTPIQLANLTATIANGGTLYRPQLVRRIEDYEGNLLEVRSPEVLHDVPISSRTLHLITHALEGVVSGKHGTGRRARIEGIRIAGKTGTAQVVRMRQEEERKEDLPDRYRDHALFVAFAPVEKPEIALAIIVEHGGHGGSAAAPIARKVLRAYFKKSGRIIEIAGRSTPPAKEKKP
ncbi:MAG: penicillin-binding protein 2 [Deltaproteobacteria bacterium]|nr:penicillin-binding protein 2 [Deltaproteobacteria bacterium]